MNAVLQNEGHDAPPPPAAKSTGSEPPRQSTVEVEGERTLVSVNKEGSARARLNSLFALALMIVLGAAVLLFYYRSVYARRSEARTANAAQLQSQANAEMALQPLPHVDPPASMIAAAQAATTAAAGTTASQNELPPLGPDGAAVEAAEEPHDPAWDLPALEGPTPRSAAVPGGAAPLTPEEQQRLQALASPVMFRSSTASADPMAGLALSAGPEANATNAAAPAGGDSPLGALLRTTDTSTVQAHALATQRWLLPKGSFLDCTLETALDSTLPGMATCITATDIFGVDGQQVLLERGTKLIGETRGEARPGQSRLFVLWSEARTPRGIIVPLASPGTDALGRSGLPGRVDTHFSERFGAAILVSVINGAIDAAVQAQSKGGNAVVYNPQGTQDILTEVLRSTIGIPPTIQVAHGSRIQVLVARDVDFRSIAALRATR